MSKQEQITSLRGLFPTLEESVIEAVLDQAGSVDAAVDPLLTLTTSQLEPKLSQQPKEVAAPSPAPVDPELARLQERIANLRKHAEEEAKQSVEENLKRQAQEEQDAKIALELSRIQGTPGELEVSPELAELGELVAREVQLEELRSQLEHTVVISQPGRIEMAMAEIRTRFYELKEKGGDINVEKMMGQLKQALAIIDVTVRNITSKAVAVGKKVKDEVESWKLLEKLEIFANTLKMEVRATLARLKPASVNEEEQKFELEDYLSKLDERAEVISEAKKN